MSRILEDATDQITQRYKQGVHSGIDIVKYKGKGFLAFIAQVRIYSSIFTINKNSKRNSYYIWYDFSRCTCINKLHVYSKIII